jgi:hypothetical protein
VLPLDYAAHATALLTELATLAGKLGDRLPLAPLVQAAEALRDRAGTLRGDDAAKNRALMAVSRALVPVDYTSGDRFRHDPALPQAPWPALDPVRALAAADGTDAIRFASVDAVRARNRVLHALREAHRALDITA